MAKLHPTSLEEARLCASLPNAFVKQSELHCNYCLVYCSRCEYPSLKTESKRSGVVVRILGGRFLCHNRNLLIGCVSQESGLCTAIRVCWESFSLDIWSTLTKQRSACRSLPLPSLSSLFSSLLSHFCLVLLRALSLSPSRALSITRRGVITPAGCACLHRPVHTPVPIARASVSVKLQWPTLCLRAVWRCTWLSAIDNDVKLNEACKPARSFCPGDLPPMSSAQ